MYIEPCCAERQLHNLIRQERGHAVLFQTSGDVTLEHLMKASFLLAGDRPRTMTLAVPELTGELLRPVADFMRKGWISGLRLMTAAPIRMQDTAQHLHELYPQADITLSVSTLPAPELLMFDGPAGIIIIQGPLFSEKTPGLHHYAALHGRKDHPVVHSFLSPFNARFKANEVPILAAAKATAETPSEAQAQPATAETPSEAQAQPSENVPVAGDSVSSTKKQPNKRTNAKPNKEMAAASSSEEAPAPAPETAE